MLQMKLSLKDCVFAEIHLWGVQREAFSLHSLAWPRSPAEHTGSDPVQRTGETAHTDRRGIIAHRGPLQVDNPDCSLTMSTGPVH